MVGMGNKMRGRMIMTASGSTPLAPSKDLLREKFNSSRPGRKVSSGVVSGPVGASTLLDKPSRSAEFAQIIKFDGRSSDPDDVFHDDAGKVIPAGWYWLQTNGKYGGMQWQTICGPYTSEDAAAAAANTNDKSKAVHMARANNTSRSDVRSTGLRAWAFGREKQPLRAMAKITKDRAWVIAGETIIIRALGSSSQFMGEIGKVTLFDIERHSTSTDPVIVVSRRARTVDHAPTPLVKAVITLSGTDDDQFDVAMTFNQAWVGGDYNFTRQQYEYAAGSIPSTVSKRKVSAANLGAVIAGYAFPTKVRSPMSRSGIVRSARLPKASEWKENNPSYEAKVLYEYIIDSSWAKPKLAEAARLRRDGKRDAAYAIEQWLAEEGERRIVDELESKWEREADEDDLVLLPSFEMGVEDVVARMLKDSAKAGNQRRYSMSRDPKEIGREKLTCGKGYQGSLYKWEPESELHRMLVEDIGLPVGIAREVWNVAKTYQYLGVDGALNKAVYTLMIRGAAGTRSPAFDRLKSWLKSRPGFEPTGVASWANMGRTTSGPSGVKLTNTYQRVDHKFLCAEGGTFVANWDASTGVYVIPELGVSSDDGDEWLTDDGQPADSHEFNGASVLLSGGPRNGTVVS